MTDEELAEIEARAAKATPGPWVVAPWDGDEGNVRLTVTVGPDAGGWMVADGDWHGPGDAPHDREANAAFMAAARADVPALLAEVRRLQGVVAEQAKALEALGRKLRWSGPNP